MTGPRLSALHSDQAGVSAVEFALLAPVLFVMLFGLFDMGANMYTSQMLNGAIQKAARNSTLEGAQSSSAAIDAIVSNAVKSIAPGASLSFDRKWYASFTDVARPEDYTDVDGSGSCDNGEPYEDANGNGSWDRDPGKTGFGGARDAVLYTVTVTYERPFPIAGFIPGQSKSMTLVSKTVLRNQPYGLPGTATTGTIKNCA